ncbi:hypothetical protein PVAP13_5NG589186 [Panicum virgatum]|uniref:Uncharacterized protein n=1 Tax=Panicum virgatum TaxID=38727 RepID=A0A8T0S404_PANVG|nr:hypothetical protein PVAP13_5NG589186 [Panicum virgatum]
MAGGQRDGPSSVRAAGGGATPRRARIRPAAGRLRATGLRGEGGGGGPGRRGEGGGERPRRRGAEAGGGAHPWPTRGGSRSAHGQGAGREPSSGAAAAQRCGSRGDERMGEN